MEPRSNLETHEVLNQPPASGDRNLWEDDLWLQRLASLGESDASRLAAYGGRLGSCKAREDALEANRYAPELRNFDDAGRRLDEVRFHPAYHGFMATSIEHGYHSVAWEGTPAGHLNHACMVYLASQTEPGHCCPLTMTYAAIPIIRANGTLSDEWAPKMLSRTYDPSVRHIAAKRGATLGMAMTEKQGGSDVRSNTTKAVPDGADWRLTGHKWFCSAPMSDGFLTLAQTSDGLTCFLVPRWLEDKRNSIHIQRLKNKLGNRSNASAEIEYHNALAHRLGAPGDGVRTIIRMVHHTRLDTAMAPAGLMRAAMREAHHWAQHRTAFQKRLIDQPLMRSVLADLSLDWVGCLALGLHIAGQFDRPDDASRAFCRVGVALAKYLSNKLCPVVVCECMEIMGGMGFIEDTGLPLLYREAPLNGIWEGSGNVICLDVLRTLAREPLADDVLRAELSAARGLDRNYDAALQEHEARWPGTVPDAEARWFAESAALLLNASIMLRNVGGTLSEAFVATRLGNDRGRLRGSISSGISDDVFRSCYSLSAN